MLQVNFAGALEFDKQRLYFFASLYDSHILFITIEGEMGLLFAWGDDANFVRLGRRLPPAVQSAAAAVSPPRSGSRSTSSTSPTPASAADGYFAVTTNTVQFGVARRVLFRLLARCR